jgi:hypothetical protein
MEQTLTDAKLKEFEVALNRFEPIHVRDALNAGKVAGVGVASGPLDFGSIPAGVLVYRADSGLVRLRLTVTEITGAFYEEFEMADAPFSGFVHAAIERLSRES